MMRAWKGMRATCYQGSEETDTTNWGNKKISMGRGVFEGGLKKGRLSKEFVQHPLPLPHSNLCASV